MNGAPENRWDSKVESSKFHESAYKDDPGTEGDEAAEESEAIGSSGVKVPIKKTDDVIQATKMVIPDFVCTAICAGLNLSDLLGEGLMIEPPEEKPINNDPQLNNPHMNSEEGLHMNTFR